MKEEIIKVAINEILKPSFELTKQFLATNKVVLVEKIPLVSDVIYSQDDEIYAVYFPIEEEDYYFVIYINAEPTPSLRFMGMSAGNKVYFYAESEHESIERLVNLLGITPTKRWRKGEIIPGNRSGRTYKNNGLEYANTEKMTGEVEDKLDIILETLVKHKDGIKELSKVAEIGINVCYCGYKEQMWGVNLKTENIKKLADLELSIDIDLYASGPDLPKEY